MVLSSEIKSDIRIIWPAVSVNRQSPLLKKTRRPPLILIKSGLYERKEWQI